MRVHPGRPSPLGATWDGDGVNFAIHAPWAAGVELCLFDRADASTEQVRVPFAERTDGVWHAFLPDARPGQIYGYRVEGPWDPVAGLRFDRDKVLLDPYAKALARLPRWDDALHSQRANALTDAALVPVDSAPFAALGAVVDPAFDWGEDRAPRTSWADTVIYELHVKGFTALNPHIEPRLRGTYLGLASEPAIRYLTSLGVTAVELLPVHQHVDERRLVDAGLVNYWGYNTIAFFAPDARFTTTGDPRHAAGEFKTMVRALHAAGLEVILDVVYNHTAEGDHRGPTLSLRGLDNAGYYRLRPGAPAQYEDVTGCGHTVNATSARTLRLIMDSLRYWVDEIHVDGFRFDLTTALARGAHGFDPGAGFLDAVAQDPVLQRVKRIAEPWDLGPDGYQVARFPAGWTEWNDRYRATVRRFWRGDAGVLPELATRLAGSSDLYGLAGRGPHASLNFVTAHDGFTLADLVSYTQKRNEANLEQNRDGESNNLSWNCGVEGETSDVAVIELRRRQRRNLLLTLLISQGVPMISGGDEAGRTQRGNNNAYCHDSVLSWTPSPVNGEARDFLEFVTHVMALRRAQPVLRRRRFLAGRAGGEADVLWLRPEGGEFQPEDWADQSRRAIGVLLDGDAITETDDRGEPIAGDTLVVLLNAADVETGFVLPVHQAISSWERIVDTLEPGDQAAGAQPGAVWALPAHSAAILRGGAAGGAGFSRPDAGPAEAGPSCWL